MPDDRFLMRLPEIARNAIADACTGSNPRQPDRAETEKLLKCCCYDTKVGFNNPRSPLDRNIWRRFQNGSCRHISVQHISILIVSIAFFVIPNASYRLLYYSQKEARHAMEQWNVSRATLGRLPTYIRYLKEAAALGKQAVSATAIAKALDLGEVQVRKDLAAVSGAGKPKVGYTVSELLGDLERIIGQLAHCRSVIVGAGKLGLALLAYRGFSDFGIEISAAFDIDGAKCVSGGAQKPIYPLETLSRYCKENDIRTGIITVPADAAQQICDMLVKCGVTAIWSFAPCSLRVPDGVIVRQENLATSLAYLSSIVNRNQIQEG